MIIINCISDIDCEYIRIYCKACDILTNFISYGTIYSKILFVFIVST